MPKITATTMTTTTATSPAAAATRPRESRGAAVDTSRVARATSARLTRRDMEQLSSPTPTLAVATMSPTSSSVETSDRLPVGSAAPTKENQSRGSSFSALGSMTVDTAVVADGSDMSPQVADVAAVSPSPPPAPLPVLIKQKTQPVGSLSAAVASPTRASTRASCGRLNDVDGCSSMGSVSFGASFKRSTIKVGYLFKQSSGSWKRKRWNQRWFVLDTETGILKYFRHESLPEAVPFRQDAHGVINLKEQGASLVIQGDLPRGVPTPFCFTVFDGSRSFLICADTNQDFRGWTSTISSILSPRKPLVGDALLSSPTTASGSPVKSPPSIVHERKPSSTMGLRCDTSVASDGDADPRNLTVAIPATRKDHNSMAPIQSPIQQKMSASGSGASYLEDARPTLKQTLVALGVLNPFVAVVRYGSIEWVYVALVGLNVFLVWVLWFQTPLPLGELDHNPVDRSGDCIFDEQVLTDRGGSSAVPSRPSSPRGGGASASSPRPESPRKPTLPRIEKLPSTAFQQTKFQGVVNGIKAKAGESIKMCPPAPAAIVTGCWTQISGTRFQVRQGPNYRKTKLKAPSDESLLELVAIDIYRSPGKVDNIASIIDLGELKPEDSPLDLFIVNCQVPSYQPSNPLWGEKQGNGEGFNFVSYFAISPEIRDQMKENEPADQAVRLLKNFMQDNGSVRDRFKAIGIVVNPQEQKLGRTERHLLETYNGQPILTRPQHRFHRGEGFFEVDVDAHEFNFVARKGLVGVSEHFRHMVVDFGYVLEGQDDQELPEQILGAVRLCKIDVRQALEIA